MAFEASHPGTLYMTELQDAELIQASRTGEFDLDQLTDDGFGLLDIATDPAHVTTFELSDQWHPYMWEGDTVPTVTVEVDDISLVRESLRHLEMQG